jgi:tetratricopeptide (TPR) repeat protein
MNPESPLAMKHIHSTLLLCGVIGWIAAGGTPAIAEPVSVMDLVFQSQEAAALNQMDSALDLARQATERDAGYGGAWKQLGSILLTQQEYEQALEPLETAAALDPGNRSILRELSTVQWKTGQTNAALDSLRAVCNLEPLNANVWRDMGAAYQSIGQYEQALEAFETSIELAPSNAVSWRDMGWTLWSLNRSEDALKAMETAITGGVPHRLDVVVQVIARLIEENHPEQALRLLAKWEPNETLLSIAIPLVEKGRLQAARPLLTQSWKLKQNPLETGLYLAYAQALGGTCADITTTLAPFLDTLGPDSDETRVRLALDTIRNCVDLIGTPELILSVDDQLGQAYRQDPQLTDILDKSAGSMRYRNHPQAAIELYRRVLDRDPDRSSWLDAYELTLAHQGSKEAVRLLADIQTRSTSVVVRAAVEGKQAEQKGHYKKAIALYETSLKADPDQPRLKQFLFDDYLQVGQLEDARAVAEWVEEQIYEGDETLRAQAAGMWMNLGEPERALDWWELLHLAFPSISYYAIEEAAATYQICRPEEAVAILEEQIESAPTPQLYELLAEIHQAQGLYEQAAATAAAGLAETPSPGLHRYFTENSEMTRQITTQTLHSSQALLESDPGHVQGSFLTARQLQTLGMTPEAIAFYEGLLERNPDSFVALVSLKDAASTGRHFRKALHYSDTLMDTRPEDVKSRLRHAIALSEAEHVRASLQLLRRTVKQNPPREMVPVLLYRGITTCPYPGRNNLIQLLGHLHRLHDEGYALVTPDTIQRPATNAQAVVILEDVDLAVLEAADELLKTLGGRAIYAGHQGLLTRPIPGKPTPDDLKTLAASGRWLIASSGPERERRQKISPDGLRGNPYTHPVFNGRRMETDNAFRKRLNTEFKAAGKTVKTAPEKILIYPFGDYGQTSLDTQRSYLDTYQQAVSNHFDKAIFYADSGFLGPDSHPLRIPARVVPAPWSSDRLADYLTRENPAVRSQLELAKLLYWNRQHVEANYWFLRALESGADPKTVQFNWGANAYQEGDLPTALRHLRTALELDPTSLKVAETLENAVNRKRISPTLSGRTWEDNEGRSFEQISLDGNGFIGDSFRLGALANLNRWETEGTGSERGLRLGLNGLWYLHRQIWVEGEVWQLQMNSDLDDFIGGEVRLHLPNRWLSGHAELVFSRQEIETVEALRAEIHANYYELVTYSRLFDKVDAFINGQVADRSDDNNTWLLNGRLVYRLKEWPYLGAGYLFRFGDSDMNPAEYWAPEQLEQHQAYASLRGSWFRMGYSLAAQAGVSRELQKDWVFIWGGNAKLNWKLTRRLSLRGEVNYQESETYNRTTATAGATIRF